MTDGDLLQSYAVNRSDDAFRAIIGRYLRLVYAACLRQLKDSHLAEDATQAVFILLSRKAGSLRQDRISGWLLTTARYACANIRKMERRRQYREQVVAMEKSADSGAGGEEFAGMLDEAMAHLGAVDREAVVLRYFRERSLREVGETLGVTEEAARKRVDRAVEKLRHYFARRGIATTAAALATVLPAQANAALGVEIQESLTQTILQTCHAGAAKATSAMAIAKGTKMMMLGQSFKTAVAVFSLMVVGLVGFWGVWSMTRTTQAQMAAAAATGPAMKLDLSTPEKALESYCAAMKAGDRAAVYACTTIDPNRTPTTGDAFLAMSLGQNHLILAAGKAFNSKEEEVRRFPGVEQVLEKVLAYDRSTGKGAVIEGESATLPFDLPEEVLGRFPADLQAEVREFVDHPMKFTKPGGDWKLASGDTRVVISLKDKQGQMVMDEKMEIAVVTEYGAIFERIAVEVEGGQFGSLADAQGALQSDLKELHDKYNLADIEVRLSPKSAASQR